MIEIKVNEKKNLLFIRFDGMSDEKELQEGKYRLFSAVNTLKPGMDVIIDISNFAPVKQAEMKYISEGMNYAVKKGLKRSIRIVDKTIPLMQLEKAKADGGLSYETIDVDSFEEAMKLIG